MYNIDVAREIYKRLLENGVNISLAGIPIVEEVLNEEDERRRTKHALDLRPCGHPYESTVLNTKTGETYCGECAGASQ